MKTSLYHPNFFYRGITLLLILLGFGCTQEKPTVKEEKPTVKMDMYLPAAGEDNALWMDVSYIDGELTRQEIHSTSSASDAYLNFQRRISKDNGKTWLPFEPIERVTLQLPEGGMVTYPGKYTYDPTLDILYQNSMRRLWPGSEMYTFDWKTTEHPFNDHTFVTENGRVRELKYEPGPDFDPENPFDSTYCLTNRAYLGQRVVVDKDGTAYFPMVLPWWRRKCDQ